MQFRINTNTGTIAGFSLLAIGAVLLWIDEPPVLQTVGVGVLVLAAIVYFLARVWMIAKDPLRRRLDTGYRSANLREVVTEDEDEGDDQDETEADDAEQEAPDHARADSPGPLPPALGA